MACNECRVHWYEVMSRPMEDKDSWTVPWKDERFCETEREARATLRNLENDLFCYVFVACSGSVRLRDDRKRQLRGPIV